MNCYFEYCFECGKSGFPWACQMRFKYEMILSFTDILFSFRYDIILCLRIKFKVMPINMISIKPIGLIEEPVTCLIVLHVGVQGSL